METDAFVRTWQSCSTLEEALNKLGLPEATALKRAAQIRKGGTPLKLFGRAPEKPEELGFGPPSFSEFQKAWSECDNANQVARKLGLSMAAVLYRAKRYRELGAKLKEFKAGRRRGSGVSKEKFIKAWGAASSLAEVGEKLGLTPKSASTMAASLRKEGVPLKKMGGQ